MARYVAAQSLCQRDRQRGVVEPSSPQKQCQSMCSALVRLPWCQPCARFHCSKCVLITLSAHSRCVPADADPMSCTAPAAAAHQRAQLQRSVLPE